MWSIYALMILKLLLEIWDVLLKSSLSRLRIVLRRVRVSSIKKVQWREKWVEDSISWPQSYKGFIVSWKLCLNLCSFKWLRLSLSLNSFRSVTNKKGIWGRSYEIKYFFIEDWNTLRVSKMGSKLFHSIIADGKIFFWKCYTLS